MLSDLPASVRLARVVTGMDYVIMPVDTGDFELKTPRGLIVRIRPVRLTSEKGRGLFEAVGDGVFRRPNSMFRGTYAMRFRYEKSIGYVEVHMDVPNPILRLVGLLARRLIQKRLAEEMDMMFGEAKSVMSAAEFRITHGGNF